MIKYSKDRRASYLANTFHLQGQLMARVLDVYSNAVTIVTYDKWKNGDFSFDKENESKEDTHVAIVADMAKGEDFTHVAVVTDVPKFDEVKLVPKEVVEAMEEPKMVMIKATTPKGKALKFALNDIEAFCAKHKLDIQAVEAVLSGVQKTHKKWGFVEVE